VRRRLAFSVLVILAGVATLYCASGSSTRPAIYWSEFAATELNFQHHFAAAERELHPIEGIWGPESSSRGQLAIVVDGSYPGYDYLVVRIRERATGRGEIVAALRSAELDLPLYEYACADALRGEPCRTFPCSGKITLMRGEFWGDPKECFCGFCASYWIRRYPSRAGLSNSQR
jgi:hypothetical protein